MLGKDVWSFQVAFLVLHVVVILILGDGNLGARFRNCFCCLIEVAALIGAVAIIIMIPSSPLFLLFSSHLQLLIAPDWSGDWIDSHSHDGGLYCRHISTNGRQERERERERERARRRMNELKLMKYHISDDSSSFECGLAKANAGETLLADNNPPPPDSDIPPANHSLTHCHSLTHWTASCASSRLPAWQNYSFHHTIAGSIKIGLNRRGEDNRYVSVLHPKQKTEIE